MYKKRMGNSPSLDDEIEIKTLCVEECGHFCETIVGKCMLKSEKVLGYIDTLLKDYDKPLSGTRKNKTFDFGMTHDLREKIKRATGLVEKMVQQALPIMMAVADPVDQQEQSLVLCTKVVGKRKAKGYKKKDGPPIISVQDLELIVVNDKSEDGWIRVRKTGGENRYWVKIKDVDYNSSLECFHESVEKLLKMCKVEPGSITTMKKGKFYLEELRQRVELYDTIFISSLPREKLGYLAKGWNAITKHKDTIKQTVVSLIFYYVVLNMIIPYFALGTTMTTAVGGYKQLKCIADLEKTMAADILSWSFDYDEMTKFIEKLPEQVKGLVSSDAIKKQLEASKTLTVKDWLELLYKKVFGDNNVKEKVTELFAKVLESIKMYLKSPQIKIAVGKAVLGLDC
jgi:hypothetical protein